MDRYRVLVCPVAAVPAFRHGEREWRVDGRRVGYLEAMSYTVWFNLLGNPAVVVPVGRSEEGLPIGVQVVGRPYEEHIVLDVAAAIERETGGYGPPQSLTIGQ
jgi:Asp-tRNA(Asn)/Glu-tRNA(Gln) amidotransferase A subunit family amidase